MLIRPPAARHTMGLFSGSAKHSKGAPAGLVTVSRSDPIATVRINNAAHDNVFTSKLVADMTSAFESISREDTVRCVVLAAEGMHFSAGPSLREMAEFSKSDAQKYWRAGKRLTDVIEEARQPVVCAIQGKCVSVGLSVALACDMRLAAENAMLSFPDIRHIQLVPGWGATQRLVHMIGSQAAKYLLITGAVVSAENARDKYGMIHDVVPMARLDSEARELAGMISGAELEPLVQLKNAINSGIDVEYGTAVKMEEQAWLNSWDVSGRRDIMQDAIDRLNHSK